MLDHLPAAPASGRRVRALTATLLTGALVLAGCSGGTSSPAAAGSAAPSAAAEPLTIGLAYGLEQSPVYPVLLRPTKAHAQRRGVTLLEGSAGGSCDKQIQDIENFIARKVDAVVYLGLCGDGSAYVPLIQSAHAAGIAMVSYAFVQDGADGSISFNDGQAGDAVAKDALAWLDRTFHDDYSSFSWGLLPCSMAPPSVQERTKRVRAAVLAQTGVAPLEDVDCALDPQNGQKATDAWLQKAPALNMVIGLNDAGALGAAESLRQSRTVDKAKVYVAGMDGQKEAVQLIADGSPVYRFTAALDVEAAGRAIIDIPSNAVAKSGSTALVLNYIGLSTADPATAQAFIQTQFAQYEK